MSTICLITVPHCNKSLEFNNIKYNKCFWNMCSMLQEVLDEIKIQTLLAFSVPTFVFFNYRTNFDIIKCVSDYIQSNLIYILHTFLEIE